MNSDSIVPAASDRQWNMYASKNILKFWIS